MAASGSPTSAGSSPVVLAGMHRSGTSLVGSILAAAGIDMGDRLLDADAHNPRGYFEDLDFLWLQRRMLVAATLEGDGGHRDWGWTESGPFDVSALSAFREQALALVEARAAAGGDWGWKDPRTTVLLAWWDDLLEQRARYFLVYRFPWEVASSMFRSGAANCWDHPDYTYRIWEHYNRRLLEFHASHLDRAVLISANAVRHPRLVELVRRRLDVDLAGVEMSALVDPDLFSSPPLTDPFPRLWLATHPGSEELLAQLEDAADLPSGASWRGSAPRGDRLRPSGDVDLSVVTPCHDDGEYLIDAVASAQRCLPERSELIIVNDGSTQGRTLEVLGHLRELGYRVIDQPNGGLAAARNRGVGEARGRYVLPLDADNRLFGTFVCDALSVLEREPDVGVVYGDRQDFGARHATLAVPDFELDRLLWGNFIDACAVYRRRVWQEAEGYDAGAAVWEDWELWISAARHGWGFRHLREVGFEYRVRPNSMLAVAEREGRWRDACEHVLRMHHDLFVERLSGVLQGGHAQLLEVSQEASALRQARDVLQGEIDRLATAHRTLLAEQGRLHGKLSHAHERMAEQERSLAAAADAIHLRRDLQRENEDDRRALRTERDALDAELHAWRERVAAMEATLAWRARAWLVRAKRALPRPGRPNGVKLDA